MNVPCRIRLLLCLAGLWSLAFGDGLAVAADKPNSVSTQPVCNVDLLPTLCAIARVGLPERKLDGADITPVFDGKPVKRRQPLYWQYDFAISCPWVASLRDGPWKLLADAELDRFELYNIVDDVGESDNLAGTHPERVKQMAAAMKRLHISTFESARSNTNRVSPTRERGT